MNMDKPVEVYFNLHKKCLSVKQNGKVVAYTNQIALRDVTFKVSEAGRQRVIKEQRKNVHATVRGILAGPNTAFRRTGRTHVGYNPYKMGSFYEKGNEQPIHEAELVEIEGTKVVAYK